ncbi:pathogenicity island protein [Staphylococcus coagulans]|uniref:pathogenicity island protein n=1 Tax=Staphylococcus coagulans TaxID=74706 RepID=UPI0015F8B31E|nr:pathogenicity island protein [Staphylococcus coagulans]MBA8764177.1 pathogenicity island protein [Staphylococcus coagulans]MBT2810385.1 pathogenicity island protein [Staphylococcus coagulans]MBT2811780.1 pathogenicity island protein [Staphylococcus coagulans]MBT2819109.1 pathogenicity island protein [Staphylococcus coagulans]MBT2821923.1 pathogenicity island protein [Staphylococcus coagulans]
MDRREIIRFINGYHKRVGKDTYSDENMTVDDFFDIDNVHSNEWVAESNSDVDDHILKNHLEMLVDQVATDKEYFIFDALLHGRNYKDISRVLECSPESVRLWFVKLLDKIMEVIK